MPTAKTKTTSECTSAKRLSENSEMLPSARLQELAKNQHMLNDMIRQAKEAEQNYVDTIKLEQQNIIDQIEAFKSIIAEKTISFQSIDVVKEGGTLVTGDTFIPVETIEKTPIQEPVSDGQESDSAGSVLAPILVEVHPAESDEVDLPPDKTPFVESESVEPVLVQPCTCQQTSSANPFYAFCKNVVWVIFALLVVYWGYRTVVDLGWLRPLPVPIIRPIIEKDSEQLKIVRSVMSDSTLTPDEQYVEASIRLYQEYYAIHGTGTDEEKREAAREFAKQHVFPNTVDDSEENPESDEFIEMESVDDDGDTLWDRVDAIYQMLREYSGSRLEQSSENNDSGKTEDDVDISTNKEPEKPNVNSDSNIILQRRGIFRIR